MIKKIAVDVNTKIWKNISVLENSRKISELIFSIINLTFLVYEFKQVLCINVVQFFQEQLFKLQQNTG